MKKLAAFDKTLIFIILTLAGIGIVMVYSASASVSIEKYKDSEYFFKKQLIWYLTGIIVMILTGCINYKYLKTLSIPAVVFTFFLFILTYIPGIGIKVGGATRWINLGLFRIQSSEIAKISTIIFIAAFCSEKADLKKSLDLKKVFMPMIIFIGLICSMIILQRDLSTSMLIFFTGMTILFFAGAKLRNILAVLIIGIITTSILIYFTSYRKQRLLAFFYPEKYKYEQGYQSKSSLIAIGSGGKFGRGIGKSRQKFSYLPVAYSDFIFSIIGEELGFYGTSGIIIIFIIFFIKGMRIYFNAPDQFSALVAIGIVSGIIYQVILNIGVVLRLLPTTGVTLPFISYGGSSLVVSFFLIGVLLNITSTEVSTKHISKR